MSLTSFSRIHVLSPYYQAIYIRFIKYIYLIDIGQFITFN